MREPFIFLCPEITRGNVITLMDWMQNDDVRRFMSDSTDITQTLYQVLQRVNLPVLTHLFNRDGRFFMVQDQNYIPVGFVRLEERRNETEIVLAIGRCENWGRNIGTQIIRESLKIAFFEMRTDKVVANIQKENIRSVRAFLSAGFRLENSMRNHYRFSLQKEDYFHFIKGGFNMNSGLFITELDRERLKKIIQDTIEKDQEMNQQIIDLNKELNKAQIVAPQKVPSNVITMNSKVRLHLDGEDMNITLVYPHEADIYENKLSVLSPIGTAILGYTEGSVIRWDVPSGTTEIEIKELLYQPESAGHYHL